MSRDLKNEYEAMLDAQIPDLWSRIEPRLTEKKAPAAGGEIAAETEAAAGTAVHAQAMEAGEIAADGSAAARRNVTAFPDQNMRKRAVSRKTVTVWASLAAACVCLAIAIPVFMRNGGRSSHDEADYVKSDDKSMAADNGWYESAYEATDGMSAPNGAPGMAANAPSESKAETSMGIMQNAPADVSADSAENATEFAEIDRADETPEPDLVNRDVLHACRAEVLESRRTEEGIYYTLRLTEAVYDLELKADAKTLEVLCTSENVREKMDDGRELPKVGCAYTFTLQAAYRGDVPCYLLIDWE